MRTLINAFVVFYLSMFVAGSLYAANAKVTNARLWESPEYMRLVLDLSSPVKHKIMMLKGPARLVLDIEDADKALSFDSLKLKGTPIKNVRSATRNKNDLRIVLDLKEDAETKSFLLKPNQQYGNRLVVDLYTKSKKKDSLKKIVKATPVGQKRDIVVVIDPGHGGEDPGAIGPNRLKEKDVVLSIAKELRKQINAKKGFKAYLTRDRDYYIGLRKRTKIARSYNTDLLVSIHADAFKKPQANGASVFALSNRGATSETARWLAKKENSADLIGGVGGVSLEDKDDVLASVLLDLSSTASLKASLGVGGRVLSSMGNVARLHKKSVQQAGFVVLKSPDIPSILVETGFISNPAESRRLKTTNYQKKMAKAIKKGIFAYFNDSPPPGTLLAWKKGGGNFVSHSAKAKTSVAKNKTPAKKYVVKKGDTLSHIAMRNEVSLNELRRLNRLRSDNVWVGQRLVVPSS
jgi:N-acetylmuramoyl-L-alanine amidase